MIKIATVFLLSCLFMFCLSVMFENGMWLYLGGVIFSSACLGFVIGLHANRAED